MKFTASDKRWRGCSEESHEGGNFYCLLRGRLAVGAEHDLSAGCELARPRRSGGQEKSVGGKAGAGCRRQKAFQTELRGMSRRLRSGSEESRRPATSGCPGSERWRALLEDHQRQSRSRHAIIQRDSGTAALAASAASPNTQATREARQQVSRRGRKVSRVFWGASPHFP